MIVTTDTDSTKLNLSPAEIAGLMGQQPGEMHVHVTQVLGPARASQPYVAPELPPQPEATPRLHADSHDGGDALRHTHEGQTQALQSVPTNEPTIAPKFSAEAAPRNVLGLPRLPERGLVFDDIQRRAHAMHCEAQVEGGGRITLVSLFGSKTFDGLQAAAAALNRCSFQEIPT
jgi:hypothetical protein